MVRPLAVAALQDQPISQMRDVRVGARKAAMGAPDAVAEV
jgi:hypothetical protein